MCEQCPTQSSLKDSASSHFLLFARGWSGPLLDEDRKTKCCVRNLGDAELRPVSKGHRSFERNSAASAYSHFLIPQDAGGKTPAFSSKHGQLSRVLVAHAYNPAYSGGTDQEDHGSKPAQANSSRDPISKIPNTKQGWWIDSSGRASMRPWVQTPAPQKKKKKKDTYTCLICIYFTLHFLSSGSLLFCPFYPLFLPFRICFP
jgi:hypothetical protein